MEFERAGVISRINRCSEVGDIFGIFGLTPETTTQKDIEHRYRELSRFVHPDAAGSNPSAETAFKIISEAKDKLLKCTDFVALSREERLRRRSSAEQKFSLAEFNAMISSRATRKRDPVAAAMSGTTPTRGPESPSGHWSFVPQYVGASTGPRVSTTTFSVTRERPVESMVRKMYSGCRKAPGPRPSAPKRAAATKFTQTKVRVPRTSKVTVV